MTTPFTPCFHRTQSVSILRIAAIAIAVSVGLLAGCNKAGDKAATQTAAKVNKEEITVHQINFLLAQQRALPPEQAASASRQVLERLIDQELEIQQAQDKKLDREPRVVQQIEAARREIVARAYVDKISEGAPKPTQQEISAYFDANPALFKARRIYSFREVNIEATPDQVEALKIALPAAKTFADFLSYLDVNKIHYATAEAVRAAEQLPLAGIEQFAKLNDGQAVFTTRPGGAQVLYLVQSKVVPMDAQKAAPSIQQFLYNQRKLKLVADDLQTLRGAAKIEYMGDFTAAAAKDPYRPASAPELPPLTSIAPPAVPGSSAVAAPQIDVAPPEVRAASMPSDAALDRGLKGMK